jgi:mRNA interferase MazF
MNINQFEIWLANLNFQNITVSGKIRPILIVQTDLLNNSEHPFTVICPLTSIVQPKANILRVNI